MLKITLMDNIRKGEQDFFFSFEIQIIFQISKRIREPVTFLLTDRHEHNDGRVFMKTSTS